MGYYRVNYRRTRYWTDYKLVQSELGVSDAIVKTKLSPSRITEVFELTEEEYNHYKQLKRERKDAEKANRESAFIQ